MNQFQQTKVVQAIAPGVIKDNAAFTATVIDTLGFDSALVVVQLGSTDIAMAGLKVEESDNNSSWTDVSASDFSVNTNLDMEGTALALPSATDDAKFEGWDLDLRKRKRYLKVTATAGNGDNGTYLSALAILGRAEVGPNTCAERGFDQIATI